MCIFCTQIVMLFKFVMEKFINLKREIWNRSHVTSCLLLCVYYKLLFNIWFLKIWEWAGSWGALAGCVGVLEKRWEDVLIRHNRIPLCPRASIKNALAASTGLSGPAGPTVGTSRAAEWSKNIAPLQVESVEFAEFWEKRLFYKPLPSVSAATLPHLHHQILNISNLSLFLSCCILLSVTLRFLTGSRQPAEMMKDCLQFLIEPAKKLKFRLKVRCVIHSFISSKGLSVKFIKIRAFFKWQARVQ